MGPKACMRGSRQGDAPDRVIWDEQDLTSGTENVGAGVEGRPARRPSGGGAAKSAQLKPVRSIVLVGLMGAGKSTVGRRLAQALRVRFRDSDDEIERAAAMSIPEIFERYGEAHFREGERRVIARLLRESPHVIATGGGAFMDAETRAELAKRAVTVWLRADLETLAQRCERRDNRPLLKAGGVRPTLARLIDERYPVYGEADITVESGDGSHDTMVAAIIKALEQAGWLKPVGGGARTGRPAGRAAGAEDQTGD